MNILIIAGGILCSCACMGGFFEYLKNVRESNIQHSVQTQQQPQQPQQPQQQTAEAVAIHVPEPVQPSSNVPPIQPSEQPIQTGACAPAADNPTTYPDPDPDPEP